MAPLAGFVFKVRINGAVFSCTRYRVVDSATGQDITNSEGTTGSGAAAVAGRQTVVAGNSAARVEISNASFDPSEDPFAAPRSLKRGTYAHVAIYPAGIAAGNPWDFPNLYLESVTHEGDAKALQPVSFSGITDGDYTTPT